MTRPSEQRSSTMAEFEPVLLRRILKKADVSLDAYRADGGYRALEKAVTTMTPEQVVEAVKDSGLRGRGGAGFPCGTKWTFLPKDHPGPIYLCVNADESEPCTFNNRILMEEDPHQVLEGILLASYATRASTAYIYVRYEYGRTKTILPPHKSVTEDRDYVRELYRRGRIMSDFFGFDLTADLPPL